MKRRPVETELFPAEGWTDGQMDMTKLIIVCRNFAKVPKSRSFLPRLNKKQNIDIYSSTS